MREAREAEAGKDLDATLEASKLAQAACPQSEEVAKLAMALEAAQTSARGHRDNVEALVTAAQFEKARQELAEARRIWRTLDGIDQLARKIDAAESEYRTAMEAANKALARKRFDEARSARAKARGVCPNSEEAAELYYRSCLQQSDDEARRNQRAQFMHRLLNRLRSMAGTFTKRLLLLAIAAALLGAVVFGAASAWPWLRTHNLVIAAFAAGVLAISTFVHSGRYTNLYRNICKHLFDMKSDGEVPAALVVGVVVALTCGGPAAGIGWLGVNVLSMKYDDAFTLGLVASVVLLIIALLYAAFCRCNWSRA